MKNPVFSTGSSAPLARGRQQSHRPADIALLQGFAPAAYRGQAAGQLDLAFPTGGDWRTAAVHAEQRADGAVLAEAAAGSGRPGRRFAC